MGNDREVLALEYHPNLPSVANVVKRHWSVMTSQSQSLKRCFKKPSIVAYRRGKSLRDILIKAKISSKRRSVRRVYGYKPCGEACQNCWHSVRATKHSCKRTGRSWPIKAPLNCKSRNVIYKLMCRKCVEFVYLGKTSRQFRQRMQEHRGYISQKKLNQPAGYHFNLPGHSKADLMCMAIEQVKPMNEPEILDIRESLWIECYDSICFGANQRE